MFLNEFEVYSSIVPVLRALISEFEEQSESNWKTEKKNGQILPFFFQSLHYCTVDRRLMIDGRYLSMFASMM